MKKEIIEKIELLVEMSGTANSYDTLSEELNTLNLEIDKQKAIVRDLKKSITNNKYLKANEKIIDENIKMGLENRLNVYYADLNDLENNISLLSLDEETVYNGILSLEKELAQLKSFLESLELKMKTIGEKDPSFYSFYDSLITKTNNDIDNLNTMLGEKKDEYQKITHQMEHLGNERTSLEDQIAKAEDRLEDVRESLLNANSYIDYRAKKTDEVAVDKNIEELENLEHKRLEILTDPAFIGYEAKELYLEDDKTSSLDKIKELVTIIQSKPYMDVNYEDLNDLLENATNKRDEFANIVENKSYDGEDVSVINMRVLYLEKLKKESEEKLETLKEEINHIDLVYVRELVQQIDQVKETRNRLNEDIETYKKVIQENEEQKTPKKKASLKSALKKKMEELENVENILNSFEQDLERTVIKSKELEEGWITELHTNIKNYEKEIADIKKKSIMNTRSKDILAVEKDKEELKRMNDDVQNIILRKKYSRTPKELFDEIEIAYGMESEDSLVVEETLTPEINLDDYRIETPLEKDTILEDTRIEDEPEIHDLTSLIDETYLEDDSLDSNKEKEVFENDVLPEESSMDLLEEIWNNPEEDEGVVDYPPRQTVTEKNRFKVIQVEPIEEEKELEEKPVESLLDDDIVLSDFEDTDYISFNDLLVGDSNEN